MHHCMRPTIKKIFDRILGRQLSLKLNTSGRSADNAASAISVRFSIGWSLRLYQDILPAYENGPINLFRGLLAIPIQFYVALWEVQNMSGIPDDLKTTASLCQVSYRATVRPWTVHMFTAIAGILFFWSVC